MSKFTSKLVSLKIPSYRRSSFNGLALPTSNLTRSLALASASALVIASAGFGSVYAWGNGSQHGPAMGSLSVLMAVGLEAAKPLAFAGALAALASFKLIRGIALAALAAVAIAYSLTAELSLIAGARGDVVAERQAAMTASSNAEADAQRARDRYDAAKVELAALPMTRPAAELQSEIDGLLLTPGADGCREINGKVTRDVCPRSAALKSELGRAQRRAELEGVMAQPIPAAVPAGHHEVRAADPAAAALSVYLAALGIVVSATVLTEWLALIPVLALEVGSAFAAVLVSAYAPPILGPIMESPKIGAAPRVSHPAAAAKEPPRKDDDTPSAPPKLSGVAKLIASHAAGGYAGSQRALAKKLGTSRRTLQRAMQALADAGAATLETSKYGTHFALA